jgi:elongation factor P--(R)-beta-lysine ligase
MPENWQPSTSHDLLLMRAELLEKLRRFMRERGILEVDTPILGRASTPDPNINSVPASLSIRGQSQSYYLHTSPEFCMKRLLASGSGAIYQISKVFRDADLGRLHQPEFAMLEWYRPDYDHHRLMDEVAELLRALGLAEAERSTYETAFVKYLDINPHTASLSELQALAASLGLHENSDDRALLLEFLFSHSVSPNLGKDKPLLLYDYPTCQAALARLSTGKPQTADRFELFISGMELANGFHELSDADEQRQRFETENNLRRQRGLAEVLIDEPFLAALQVGLPDCAGVALGIDRLLMVLSGKQHIDEVMTFPLGDA